MASAGSSFLPAWIVHQGGLQVARWHERSGRALYACVIICLICISAFSIKKAEAIALAPDIINLQDAHERMGLVYLQYPERFADFIAPMV